MTLKVIITVGLPASGKTTFAKNLLKEEPGKWKRINKDLLRILLDGGQWSKANEKFVEKARNALILESLNSGFSTIIDDTNLHPKHIKNITELVKDLATVEIKDFTDVPLEECIKRDQGRSDYVGEAVIRRMYNQFLKPPTPVVEIVSGAPNAIICDLDGTLALFGDANPYDRDFSKDEVNEPLYGILENYFNYDTELVLVSGRTDKYRKQTEDWLVKNAVFYDKLFMRKDGDTRKDVIIKQEIYEAEIKGRYNVLFILDDRDQVVNFWRSQGLTCLQVNYGDF